MKKSLMNLLFKTLFFQSPNFIVSREEEEQFQRLFDVSCQTPGQLIDYNLSAPKSKFLHYISVNKRIVFHGSNNKNITSFEPRQQTLFNGKMATAVFASKDPIWPIFYAVLDKGKVVSNFRNGSLSTDRKKKYHFYSLTKQTHEKNPWTTGMIYFLPEESFTYIGNGAVQFDEWISTQSVSPLAKMEIKPEDFYFMEKVATHRADESVIRTWLLYKWRTLRKK